MFILGFLCGAVGASLIWFLVSITPKDVEDSHAD